MVEGPGGLLCPDRAGTIELSEELLGFGIDGKQGIPCLEILALEIVIFSNCALRNGDRPPARTFAILYNAKPFLTSQSRMTGGLTGVHNAASSPEITAGEKSIDLKSD